MDRIVCTTTKKASNYDIIIGKGVISDISSYIKKYCKGENVAIITDSTVKKLYGEIVVKGIKEAGLNPCVFAFEAGEKSKNINTISQIYDFLCENEITRSDLLVALGGGVTGDMCGFAAATYLRGTPFIQIPTTLLADVDASVGGKTGYDLPQGKNLIGAFNQPLFVLIETDFLSTLTPVQYADGMAEIIKTALLFDKEMFSLLEENKLDIDSIIARCIHYKSRLVKADERDMGLRSLLNLGHTFGHAIEKLGRYETVSHGQGVAIGMVIAAAVGEALKLTKTGTKEKIINILKAYNLPTATAYTADEIFGALTNDKKRLGADINIVLLSDIGEGFIHKISLTELKEVLKGAI